jgi:hypothetical protein
MLISNIKKVVIVDDDWAIAYSRDGLVSSGVEQDALERLEDEDDPDTRKYIELLKSNGLPHTTLDEKIIAFSHPQVVKECPGYYIEKIIKVHEENYSPKREKLELIVNALTDLGFDEQIIFKFNNPDACDVNDEALYIVDLFLKEADFNVSLNFLRGKISALEGMKSQFIIMSYDHDALMQLFDSLRKELKVSPTRFKFIDKPNGDTFNALNWHNGIVQLDKEYSLIDSHEKLLKKMDIGLSRSFEDVRTSLWSLDGSAFYKFLMSARADNMSLSEYFSDLIMWHLMGFLEEGYSIKTLLDDLEVNLGESVFLGPSVEGDDSNRILKNILMDVVSYRQGWIEKNVTSVISAQELKEFISVLKFGTIIQHVQSSQLYIHLTRPCDYIHVKPEKIDDTYLVFLRGKEFSIELVDFEKNEIVTPYVNVDGRPLFYEWHLKKPFTPSIGELIDGFGSKYKILGQLRNGYAADLVNQYSSIVSKAAMPRLPNVTSMHAYHIFYDSSVEKFSTFFGGDVKPIDDLNFDNEKVHVFRIKDQKDGEFRLVFPYSSASKLAAQLKRNNQPTVEDIKGISKVLMEGVSSSKIEFKKHGDDLMFAYEKNFFEKSDASLTQAKELYAKNKTILNYIVFHYQT